MDTTASAPSSIPSTTPMENLAQAALLRAHPVEITVNNHSVTMAVQEATGLEIKETAIAQGVSIKRDFVLMVERGNSGKREPVADDERIHLHAKQHFFAIPPDDNS